MYLLNDKNEECYCDDTVFYVITQSMISGKYSTVDMIRHDTQGDDVFVSAYHLHIPILTCTLDEFIGHVRMVIDFVKSSGSCAIYEYRYFT